MPSFSSKVQLSSTAQSNNIVLADVDRIKGAFKTYVSASTMNATSVNYFSDGQIVYVEDSASLFQATVTPADPPNSFVDTVTFKPFSFVTGSFVSASFDGTKTLTLFGQDLSGSSQVSMSVDLSALTGSGGGASTLGGLSNVSASADNASNGNVLMYNASAGVWEASNVSGTGDISAVFAGDGLSGGGTAGSVSLDVSAGLGVNLTGGNVNVDTGSSHFTSGVGNQLDGGEI